jgi:hypothetical protein
MPYVMGFFFFFFVQWFEVRSKGKIYKLV